MFPQIATEWKLGAWTVAALIATVRGPEVQAATALTVTVREPEALAVTALTATGRGPATRAVVC